MTNRRYSGKLYDKNEDKEDLKIITKTSRRLPTKTNGLLFESRNHQ